MTDRLACPTCGETTTARRVSAILRSDTSVDPTTAGGVRRSMLAERLEQLRPVKREMKIPRSTLKGMPFIRYNVGCITAMVAAFFAVQWFYYGIFTKDTADRGAILIAILATVVFIVSSGVTINAVRGVWKKLRSPEMASIAQEIDTQQQAAESTFQAELKEWNDLYYCEKCDGVFVPGDETVRRL